MASNEVNIENTNMSGSDKISDLNFLVSVNPLALLVPLNAVEILSPHELCLTYENGVELSRVAGELMAIESWMDFPVLIMVVIITRSKVDDIVKARQKHRRIQRE